MDLDAVIDRNRLLVPDSRHRLPLYTRNRDDFASLRELLDIVAV